MGVGRLASDDRVAIVTDHGAQLPGLAISRFVPFRLGMRPLTAVEVPNKASPSPPPGERHYNGRLQIGLASIILLNNEAQR